MAEFTPRSYRKFMIASSIVIVGGLFLALILGLYNIAKLMGLL